MMGLEELKEDRTLIDAIDWDMTPEEAVRLYLEWGNNWSRGYRMVRSKDDESHYFVLSAWEDDPVIYFVKRNSEGSVELATVDLPEKILAGSEDGGKLNKGIYAVDGELREWLQEELNCQPA